MNPGYLPLLAEMADQKTLQVIPSGSFFCPYPVLWILLGVAFFTGAGVALYGYRKHLRGSPQ